MAIEIEQSLCSSHRVTTEVVYSADQFSVTYKQKKSTKITVSAKISPLNDEKYFLMLRKISSQ